VICSTIIPTVGRTTLARAIKSVLEQGLEPELHEIILVNDSGTPLLGMADWLKLPRVTVITTNRCERSVARNVGAAIASGEYLHFLDDDDYLLPGALTALLRVAESSDACWIYGGVRCVNDEGEIIAEIRPEVTGNIFAHLVTGASLPLGVSLIRRETFFRLGGFDHDHLLISLEDRDLACRFALVADFDRTGELVACYRVEHRTSTTDWSKAPKANHVLREKALNVPGVLTRMLDSIGKDVHLRGRGCRAYLASAADNFRAGSYLRAVSRLLFCARLAGPYVLSPRLWRGML
jgi:hypothetical protein